MPLWESLGLSFICFHHEFLPESTQSFPSEASKQTPFASSTLTYKTTLSILQSHPTTPTLPAQTQPTTPIHNAHSNHQPPRPRRLPPRHRLRPNHVKYVPHLPNLRRPTPSPSQHPHRHLLLRKPLRLPYELPRRRHRPTQRRNLPTPPHHHPTKRRHLHGVSCDFRFYRPWYPSGLEHYFGAGCELEHGGGHVCGGEFERQYEDRYCYCQQELGQCGFVSEQQLDGHWECTTEHRCGRACSRCWDWARAWCCWLRLRSLLVRSEFACSLFFLEVYFLWWIIIWGMLKKLEYALRGRGCFGTGLDIFQQAKGSI